jgi:hypothetical protein
MYYTCSYVPFLFQFDLYTTSVELDYLYYLVSSFVFDVLGGIYTT